MLKKIIILTALVLAALANEQVISAQTAPVRGVVYLKRPDGSEVPVKEALIEVYRSDIKGRLPSAKTDRTGKFAFAGFPLGARYAFVVSGVGIAPDVFLNIRAGMEDVRLTVYEGSGGSLTEEEVRQKIGGTQVIANPAAGSSQKETPKVETPKIEMKLPPENKPQYKADPPTEPNRGVGIRLKNSQGQTQEIRLYEGSYALIIGESNYTNGWSVLSGVADDVAAVGDILRKQGFRVETALNLPSLQFKPRIDKFISDYGYEKNNRLLIYYAGHGHTLKSIGDNRELGYIVPIDSPDPNKDEKGFRQTAISMKAMQSFAEEIQAKHALFVFDSCFSGKIFALRDNPVLPPQIEESVAYPVRQIITAGDEKQKVPDESIFRKAFVRGLEGDADYNKDGYVTGVELGMYLRDKVTTYTNRSQTPRFGTINDIDLDRGDFVFETTKNH